MAKFVDEMVEYQKKFDKTWRGTSKTWRDLAEKCGILTESGGKQRNLAKFGEKR